MGDFWLLELQKIWLICNVLSAWLILLTMVLRCAGALGADPNNDMVEIVHAIGDRINLFTSVMWNFWLSQV